MKNIVVIVFGVLGLVFVMSGVRFVSEKMQVAEIHEEAINIPLDAEFTHETADFTIQYPQEATVEKASTSAVRITYTLKENNQTVQCYVEGIYEPEKQLFLPDFELPEYDSQRVTVGEWQWIYTINPDPQWVTLIEGYTYYFRTNDTEHDRMFCRRILNTFQKVRS